MHESPVGILHRAQSACRAIGKDFRASSDIIREYGAYDPAAARRVLEARRELAAQREHLKRLVASPQYKAVATKARMAKNLRILRRHAVSVAGYAKALLGR